MRAGHRNPQLGERLRTLAAGGRERLAGAVGVQARLNDDGSSFSGNERNCLFLSDHGRQFTDVSALSSLDSPSDGRSFVIWDYDRDGWIDIAAVNANSPRLQLWRNALGGQEATGTGPHRGIIAVRFVGGNRTSAAAPGWSSRDGFGARVELDLGDLTIDRELRAGEGLAAQNSTTLVIGIGTHATARTVTVRWPSGRVQSLASVGEGTLLTAFEDASQSRDGSGFASEPYRRSIPPARKPLPAPRQLILSAKARDTAPLRMYSTMATWCEACRKEVPQLRRLRAAFKDDELAMFGVAIDAEDDASRLRPWLDSAKPPYRLLDDLTAADRDALKAAVVGELHQEAVPATLITDARGRLVAALWGPPSVSRIRELLAAVDGAPSI